MNFAIINLLSNVFMTGFAFIGIGTAINKIGKFFKIVDENKENGFKIEYATYIFSILPIPVFLFRTIPSFLGFHKNSNDLEKYKGEHSQKTGILNYILDKIWNFELNRIKNKKKLPLGGSCFVVGRKTDDKNNLSS